MSKKKKGLSFEEKRNILLGIYHEKMEPFNLKEIESLGSKLGVIQQTVKDVNQSLCDDSLVQSDKIGSANFFWSFPSKSYQDQINLKEKYEILIKNSSENIEKLKADISEAKTTRKDPKRAEKLEALNSLKNKIVHLDTALEDLKFNDPEEIEKVNQKVLLCKSGAERWTDNIWALKTYLIKKKGMSGKEVDKILQIDGEFDYADYETDKQKSAGQKRKK